MEITNKGKKLIAVGLLLIIAALCLVAYNLYDSMRAASSANEAVQTMQQQLGDGRDDYKKNSDIEMPKIVIDGEQYIAMLEIPKLGLVLPVMSEWSDNNLKVAPCRYSGSVYKDDMVIAAHNYRLHFGRIKDLAQGDDIYIVDVDGNVFEYEVAMIETLQPTDVEEMKTSDWDLTMFTCTLGGQSRVTVRCIRN